MPGKRGVVMRYHTKLIVLQTYFDHEALSAIDGGSSFVEPAILEVPFHGIEFIETDRAVRVELESVLNTAGNNKKLYSHFWRDPEFQLTNDIFNHSLLGTNGFIILMIEIVFVYQQYKLRQVYTIVMTIQAR